jgi:hypothetical protein
VDSQAVEDLLALARERGIDVDAIPTERLLRNWRLVRDTNGGTHLTLAGVLLLGRVPVQFQPTAYVSALSILGRDISIEPVDQKRIEGALAEVLRAGRGVPRSAGQRSRPPGLHHLGSGSCYRLRGPRRDPHPGPASKHRHD